MLGNFQDTCIHQLFEFQVKLTPDAIAVIFEGKQLTYQELNSQANQWAHYLKTLGVGPEVLVASLCGVIFRDGSRSIAHS